jgi:hypothetical protein
MSWHLQIYNGVESTRAIDEWLNFARPCHGNHIADMELLTVHCPPERFGLKLFEIEIFDLFWEQDRPLVG